MAVAEALRVAAARFEGLDESDAFAVLNWGMSECDGYCFAQTGRPVLPVPRAMKAPQQINKNRNKQ